MAYLSFLKPVAHPQQVRSHGAKGPPLLVPRALSVGSDSTDDDRLLMDIQTCASLIHDLHRSPPLNTSERAGNGMPSLGQSFPYVLLEKRATDGGAWQASRSHWWSGSQHEYQADL